MTSGFYGNDINLYLPIDKIYPNYTTAQKKAYYQKKDGTYTTDEVFLGRYVLINYNFNENGEQTDDFNIYTENKNADKGFYHLDILRKSLNSDGIPYYATVGSLNLSKLANPGESVIDFNSDGLDYRYASKKEIDTHYDGIRLNVQLDEENPNVTQTAIFTLNIPELGNAISDMWNIVFDVDDDGTRKTNLNRIPPTNETEPKRSENLNTLAGCLNHFADLLGYHCFYTSLDGTKNDAINYSKNRKTSYYWDLFEGKVYKYYDQAETKMFEIDKTGNVQGESANGLLSVICEMIYSCDNQITAIENRGNAIANTLENLLQGKSGRGIDVGSVGFSEGGVQGEVFNSYAGSALPNIASKSGSHAEGLNTQATAARAHAEGYGTIASGQNSHTEGYCTHASGVGAHAEGIGVEVKSESGSSYSADTAFGAIGKASHTEGEKTLASGTASHAGGIGTIAASDAQTAIGRYNVENDNEKYLFIVGNGTDNTTRSNAFTVDKDGNIQSKGNIYAGSEILATKGYLDAVKSSLEDYTDQEVGIASTEVTNHANKVANDARVAAIDYTSNNYLSKTSASNTYAKLSGGNTFSGNQTINGALAQGYSCIVDGDNAHAEGRFTSASGFGAHAEGNGDGEFTRVIAEGHGAHAEGYRTSATGQGAHAEGRSTIANGDCSHAEGQSSEATAQSAHAEGGSVQNEKGEISPLKTIASGVSSHAEGVGTNASKNGAHAEGYKTFASGKYSHAEGSSLKKVMTTEEREKYKKQLQDEEISKLTDGQYTSFETFENSQSPMKELYKLLVNTIVTVTLAIEEMDNNVIAEGIASHAEGRGTKAYGTGSHAEGYYTSAYAGSSHIEGGSKANAELVVASSSNNDNKKSFRFDRSEWDNDEIYEYWNSQNRIFSLARGNYCHVEGYDNIALGNYSHAEGIETAAVGNSSHTEGYQNQALGRRSHAGGHLTQAEGLHSFTHGLGLKAYGNQAVFGYYNNTTHNGTNKPEQNAGVSLFMVGNGTKESSSNAFRVRSDGHVLAGNNYSGTGADFAEYFEWEDGNLLEEDRRGLFVTLEGEKIRLATSDDSYILGAISSNEVLAGNTAHEDWQNKYLKDIFGKILVEKIEIPEHLHEESGEIIPSETIVKWKINPEYNPDQEYIPREFRKEWDPVGLCGQVVVVDDGTCEVNGYCYPGQNGVGTKSDKGYRVMKRLDDTHIKVLIK